MHSESFEENFTYVGQAPELTLEEEEERLIKKWKKSLQKNSKDLIKGFVGMERNAKTKNSKIP
jgi:hypothetical protein